MKYTYYCEKYKRPLNSEPIDKLHHEELVMCQNEACKSEHNLTSRSNNLVITVDVKFQLHALLTNRNIFSKLKPPTQDKLKTRNTCNIKDITDGVLYHNLLKNGISSDLTYNFSTDGAPIFHSSKLTMWPIQMIINELPPNERFKHVIFAGIWVGKEEPNNHLMNTILRAFVGQARHLQQHGIKFTNPLNGKGLVFKLVPLVSSVDSVARPLLQNRLQFNGYFGCSWCYHPGTIVERQIKYPFLEGQNASVRTHEFHNEDLKGVIKSNYTTKIRGVKGPSVLLGLPHFDIVWSLPPDYMHGVILGVVRQMWDLWVTYSPKNRLTFYLGGPKQKTINERLMKIKPPSEIHRLPRLLTEKQKWKASEWRSWLLFYAGPCLEGTLNLVYWSHFVVLSNAIASLLATEINFDTLHKVECDILAFVKDFEFLYGKECMTFNLHSLTHLCQSVKRCGPLWATSTSPFESEI